MTEVQNARISDKLPPVSEPAFENVATAGPKLCAYKDSWSTKSPTAPRKAGARHREQIHLYGCAAVEPTGEEGIVRVTGLVEKPPREAAPSAYAVIGRYVLDPAVFDVLEGTAPGRGGEIQLTDALQELAAGGTVHGVMFNLRYDTGDKSDYLRTVVRLACDRPDLGPGFVSWLKEFVAELEDRGRLPARERFAA